jgi:hypothetical protein
LEDDTPNVTKRLSSTEWSGASPIADRGSKNTLAASKALEAVYLI